MVSVDEFVEASIAAHPSLFTNRTDVLHFILCVNGNGYEWGKDGVPVNLFPDNTVFDRDEYIERSMSYFGKSLPKELLDPFRSDIEQEADEYAQIAAEAAARATVRGELNRGDVYQQTQYALLTKMPENAPEDWREACDEIRELVVNAGWVL